MPGRSSSSSGRSSSGRSLSGRSSSKPSYSYSSPKSPVSAPVSSPPVSQNHQVQQPGFLSNMWQGFGLGAGQSIAMNIFRSDPKVTHVYENAPTQSPQNITESFYSNEYTQCLKDKYDDKETCKNFIQCLKDNKDDKTLCKQYM
jgi:hypothetical protein